MPDIVYTFIERGKESVKSGFREIGAEARNTTRDVEATIRAIQSLARVGVKLGGGGGRRGPATQASGEASKVQREVKDRAGIQERLGKEIAAAQQRRERDTAAVASRAAKDRASEDAKQAQLQAARAAAERRQRDADHRATLARTKSQGLAERDYWAERRRRQTATFHDEDRAGRRRKQLDDERKRSRERQFQELNIGGAIKGAVIGGSLAVGALGLGVTGAAARESLRLREISNRISINSRLPGQTAVDPAVLQREFEATAIRTPGQKAATIAEAVQGFVTKTGRLDVARASQQTLATVASASGADIRDVANTAADLFQKFDVTGAEEMAEALAALTVQGKKGAFEIKDAAANFSRMSAAAARFGVGTGLKGVKTLGGLSQIAMETTGKGEVAATAVEATLRQFVAQAGNIKKKFGVDVFKDKGKTQTRDIQDVIVGTIAGAKGNQTELQKVFGDEGIKGISALITTFNKASGATVGTEAQKTAAGIAALRARLAEAIEVSDARSEIERDAAQAQQDASAKLTASWERLQSKVGDAVVPMLTDLADKFANSPEVIDAFIGTIEVMIDAMKGFVLVLEDLGLVKKKVKSPDQVEKEKRAEADRLQADIERKEKAAGGTFADVLNLTKQGKHGEAAALEAKLKSPELIGLRSQRNALDRDADAAIAEGDRQRRIQQARTPEEFAAQYRALGGANQDTRGLTAAFGPDFAAAIAQQIKAAPYSAAAASGDMQIAGETQSQREFRLAQGQAARETKTQVLGVTGDDQAGKAMVGLAVAAGQLESAFKRIAAQGQPSPVGT